LPALLERARRLLAWITSLPASERRGFLEAQVRAAEAHLRVLGGESLGWDQQVRLLYDLEPDEAKPQRLGALLETAERLLPGRGPLAERLRAFPRGFRIPPARLAAAVKLCLAELRERARDLVRLPPRERVRVSLVRGRPWGAYCWYLGGFASRIEINRDFRFHPANLLHVLAHEAYPGHHAYNALRDWRLVRGRGWAELSLHPVLSPQSVLAEGVSNVALDIVMPREERPRFVHDRLAPLADLGRRDFESYLSIWQALRPMHEIGVEAARLVLEESDGRRRALELMARYGFSPRPARQHLRFFERYGAYVCTYTAGEDLVRGAVGGGPGAPERYLDLFLRAVAPSALRRAENRIA
jgi:hypothetical protein